jgi:hypothetical protein
MNVVLVTNLDERCGSANHGRSLHYYMQKYCKTLPEAFWNHVRIAPAEYADGECPLLDPADVVLVNWHPARVTITAGIVQRWQARGKKVALILQNSLEKFYGLLHDDILCVADLVIAQEPMQFTYGDIRPLGSAGGFDHHVDFKFIPHAIHHTPEPPVALAPEPVIGTAGFPAPWKRMDLVARVAKELGVRCEIFAPDFPLYDSRKIVEECRALGATVHTEFYEETEIIRRLASHWVNIFWFENQTEHDLYGQTGAARMGLSAARPMIISRHHKFRTLIEKYPPDEFFHVAENESDVARICSHILMGLRMFKDMSSPGWLGNAHLPYHPSIAEGWPVVAEMYWNALQKLVTP